MNVQVKSTELPPFKPLPMKAPDVEFVRKDDGTLYISQRHKLGPAVLRARLSHHQALFGQAVHQKGDATA